MDFISFGYTVLTVILFFCVCLIASRIIFRACEGGIHYVTQMSTPEVAMESIINPFSLKLTERNVGDLAVECLVNCKVESNYSVFGAYGVPINTLRSFLGRLPEAGLPEFMRECVSATNQGILTFSPFVENRIRFTPSERADVSLWSNMNEWNVYTFVVIMVLHNQRIATAKLVRSMTNIIYLPPIGSGMSPQNQHAFITLFSGQIVNVERAYLNVTDNERTECLICFSTDIIVLLPCGHGCVCIPCFRRLETNDTYGYPPCPTCRGPILSYFSPFRNST